MPKYDPVELWAMAQVLVQAKRAQDRKYDYFVAEVARLSGVPVEIVEQKIEEYATRFGA